MQDFLIATTTTPEPEIQANENREYFAVTPEEFLMYNKETENWKCLRTGIEVQGKIPEPGETLDLIIRGKPMTHGKWATAASTDDILDFYNSGTYLDWLAEQNRK